MSVKRARNHLHGKNHNIDSNPCQVYNPVSLKPSLAVNDPPDLSTMSLESVVSRFKEEEKKHTAKFEPENLAEVFWMVRSAPVELMSSLHIVSTKLGVSRSILTKCMSRQVADWYTNSLGIDELTRKYDAVYKKIKLASCRSLRTQAENPAKFSYVSGSESVDTSISSIRWIVAKMGELKRVLGVSSTELLLVGFCWSLTTLENRDWDKECIRTVFIPEARNMEFLVRDRLIDVDALRKKCAYRIAGFDEIS